MGTTELEIKQNALILLGQSPIQTLADETDQNAILLARYPVVIKSFLTETLWNFTTKTVQLSREAVAAVGRFNYEYALPSDCVSDGVIAAYPSDAEGTTHILDYVIQDGYLRTDRTAIWVDYQYEVDESNFPDYVTDVICHQLAADTALALTDNIQLATSFEQRKEAKLQKAIRRNAKQSPPNNLINRFPLLDAHHGKVRY
jgi:hypothetical protein